MDTYSAICLLDFLSKVRRTKVSKRYIAKRLVTVEKHIMALRRFANLRGSKVAEAVNSTAAKLQSRVDTIKKEIGS